MEENSNVQSQETKKNWHDRYYKFLLVIPAVLLIFSIAYMINFYSQNGDFINKDISLTGGTSVTLYEKIDIPELSSNLKAGLEDVNVREIYDLVTREQKAVIIETASTPEQAKTALEKYLGHELTDENSSFEFTGSSLSRGFYKQLLIAILVAFIAMGIVVFIIFRVFIPSIAVIISAFADILMTLVAVNLLRIEVSTAGIVAFLMLIGYSVDTDILLTSRVLKRDGESLNKKIFESFKTGITMTLTALLSVLVALFIVKSFSNVLAQIFTILVIGLCFDIINTWITNVSLLKWYMKRKNG